MLPLQKKAVSLSILLHLALVGLFFASSHSMSNYSTTTKLSASGNLSVTLQSMEHGKTEKKLTEIAATTSAKTISEVADQQKKPKAPILNNSPKPVQQNANNLFKKTVPQEKIQDNLKNASAKETTAPQSMTQVKVTSSNSAQTDPKGQSQQENAGNLQAIPASTVPFGENIGPGYNKVTSPQYPAVALRQQISGKVLLRVRLTAQGEVAEVEVLSSSHKAFTQAAERALRASTFHPYAPNGRAEECWTVIPVEFRLTS